MPSNHVHRFLCVAIVICAISGIRAFQPGSKIISRHGPPKLFDGADGQYSTGDVIDCANDTYSSHALTRRIMFRTLLRGIVAFPSASIIVGNPNLCSAAAAPSPAELKKLQLGHARVQVG